MTDKCAVCNKNAPVGVACVPGIPMSVAYCVECLEHNAHPFEYLRCNITLALQPDTAHRWNDPEVINQDYIDCLNVYYQDRYMTFREALTLNPPTREELLKEQESYEQWCKEQREGAGESTGAGDEGDAGTGKVSGDTPE